MISRKPQKWLRNQFSDPFTFNIPATLGVRSHGEAAVAFFSCSIWQSKAAAASPCKHFQLVAAKKEKNAVAAAPCERTLIAEKIAGVNVAYVTQSAVAVDHDSSSKDEKKGQGIYRLRLKIKLKPSDIKLFWFWI